MKFSALFKNFIISSLLLAILITFSGCSRLRLPGKKKEPVTLKYWGLWESKQNIQSIIDTYQKNHPEITIEYSERSPKFYYDTLTSRLNSELSPDIVRVHSTWIPFLAKYLAPLPSTIMSKESFEKTFYPVAKEILTVDDSIYALPLEYDGLALLYNEDLFSKEGLTTPPETWDQFKDYAKKLTKRDQNGKLLQSGAALGTASNIDHFSDILGLMMFQAGVTFQDPKTKKAKFHESISVDGRNLGAEALEFYTQFAESWSEDWPSSFDVFLEGRVTMIFAPSWRILNVLEASPNFPLKVAPVPQLPETQMNWASFWVEAVSSQSKHQAEAWDFLNFLLQKEQLLEFYKTATATRRFGEPYSRKDLATSLEGDFFLSPYIKAAPTAHTWYLCSRTFDTKVNDTMMEIFAQAVDGVLNKGNLEKILEEAATKADQLLSQLK